MMFHLFFRVKDKLDVWKEFWGLVTVNKVEPQILNPHFDTLASSTAIIGVVISKEIGNSPPQSIIRMIPFRSLFLG